MASVENEVGALFDALPASHEPCPVADVEEALTYIFECEYASGRDVIEELDGVEYGLGIACLRKSCKSAL